MSEILFQWLDQYFSRELAVFFSAWLPIIELRGAIPLAISMGIPPLEAFLLSVTGNAVPVIPLLFFLEPVRRYLVKHFCFLESFFNWLDRRTAKKGEKIDRYGALGLILFTAIPLPVTGAWTASLAAIMFKIKFRYAIPAILVGILIAGIIVLLITVTGMAIL